MQWHGLQVDKIETTMFEYDFWVQDVELGASPGKACLPQISDFRLSELSETLKCDIRKFNNQGCSFYEIHCGE